MAHFIGTVSGGRGEASRLGHKSTGLKVKCNGWDAGVTVYASHNDAGHDVFEVWSNGGSNGGAAPVVIATIINGEVIK